MADTIKEILKELSNNAATDDLSYDWDAAVDQALAEIKRIIEEAKPNRQNKEYRNPIYNAAVYDYHNDLLKALGE